MDEGDRDTLRAFAVDDSALTLRRFMSVKKFRFLLEKGLYFSPASQFADGLEGHYTHLQERERAAWIDARKWGARA
ncbi:MAG TPA: hypothetical protein VEB22_03650, partial [Phycisphaerales bacterium]|nr:hypothetical protein [Phycisphaerales bacterium]